MFRVLELVGYFGLESQAVWKGIQAVFFVNRESTCKKGARLIG